MLAKQALNKKEAVLENTSAAKPNISFYTLQARTVSGKTISFENFRGKKILLVNTASNCGYTAQYDELQKLQDAFDEELTVIGFPSADFKQQERLPDHRIAEFCQRHFGVRFPLVKKSVVSKKPGQHPVFRWLTHKDQNGWNDEAPGWNFCKYLVNEEGVLTHVFPPFVSPAGREIFHAVGEPLAS